MTAWSIWRKLNLQLWEDNKVTVQQVIGRAQGMLQAWQHARKTDAASRRQQQVHHVAWQPPPAGVVKCNIDAAIFDTEQKVGMGAYLRDEEGHFIAAMTANTDAVMTAAESEACITHNN
jgi:hypothetical protein